MSVELPLGMSGVPLRSVKTVGFVLPPGIKLDQRERLQVAETCGSSFGGLLGHLVGLRGVGSTDSGPLSLPLLLHGHHLLGLGTTSCTELIVFRVWRQVLEDGHGPGICFQSVVVEEVCMEGSLELYCWEGFGYRASVRCSYFQSVLFQGVCMEGFLEYLCRVKFGYRASVRCRYSQSALFQKLCT